MESIGVPETYSDTYTNTKGDITVNIDVDIEVPPVLSIPAFGAELGGFPQEMIDKFAEYFLDGAQVYTEEDVLTKDEIMDMILSQKQSLQTSKEAGADKDTLKLLNDTIANLTEEYKTAPEQRERTSSTTELIETGDGIGLNVVADLGKDESAGFIVRQEEYGQKYGNSFCFINDGKGEYSPFPIRDSSNDAPRGMAMTYEDAERIVMQCLADLEIDAQITDVIFSTFFRGRVDYNDEQYRRTAKQCYMFTLVRTLGGIPIENLEASVQTESDDPNVVLVEPQYNYIVEPESITIYVDDTGIARFEWKNYADITSVLSQNVTLMPFEDVLDYAKSNIFYKNYTAYGTKANIQIDKISLNMMRIMKKDSQGEFLFVPVWDFIGNQGDLFGNRSFVTINAIDGSSINRDWGY